MGSRVARLEASIQHLERDIADIKIDARSMRESMDRLRESMDRLRDRVEDNSRIVWAGMITLGLGLSGLMAKGFGWL